MCDFTLGSGNIDVVNDQKRMPYFFFATENQVFKICIPKVKFKRDNSKDRAKGWNSNVKQVNEIKIICIAHCTSSRHPLSLYNLKKYQSYNVNIMLLMRKCNKGKQFQN